MKILWRISIKETNVNEQCVSEADKFGDPMNSSEEILRKFQKLYKEGYKVDGIHFHAGSGHLGITNFPEYMKIAKECMIKAREIGHPVTILDIGGGFAGNYIEKDIQIISTSLQ